MASESVPLPENIEYLLNRYSNPSDVLFLQDSVQIINDRLKAEGIRFPIDRQTITEFQRALSFRSLSRERNLLRSKKRYASFRCWKVWSPNSIICGKKTCWGRVHAEEKQTPAWPDLSIYLDFTYLTRLDWTQSSTWLVSLSFSFSFFFSRSVLFPPNKRKRIKPKFDDPHTPWRLLKIFKRNITSRTKSVDNASKLRKTITSLYGRKNCGRWI